jgi:uncharacterized membrane protein YfbV (UPF0208 family)
MSTGKVSPASGMEMETNLGETQSVAALQVMPVVSTFICTNVIYAEDSTSNIITTILLLKYKFQEIHLYKQKSNSLASGRGQHFKYFTTILLIKYKFRKYICISKSLIL